MNTILDIFRYQAGNQFVSGGLLLMFTGSLIALARSLPARIWAFCRRHMTRTVLIANTDPLFDYVTYWLNSQERFRLSRSLMATTELRLKQRSRDDDDDDDCSILTETGRSPRKQALRVFFSPSSGRHFFLYQKVWLSIHRDNKESSKPGGSTVIESHDNNRRMKEESYTLSAYGKTDGQALKNLVQEIIDFGTQETEGIRLYASNWGHWSSNGYTRMRPLATVVLPAGTAELILEDMREFRRQEHWYRDLGIPWHKGYLFHGVAGSGKTSLAAALAGELEMDVYLLNLSGTGMNDEALQALMSNVRTGCMVVLEDIDCTVPERDEKNRNHVTLSGLLNCLDGMMSREGCVIVMTTNRREVLDSALVRPGRVDFEMEFSYAEYEQIERLARRIGVSAEGFYGRALTMAEVQKELLERHRNNQALKKSDEKTLQTAG